MKNLALTILLLLILSLPALGQTYIAIGPQLGTLTASAFTGGSQTQAGGQLNGQVERRLGPLSVAAGGSMALLNQPRFFDNGVGATFEAEPDGRMYFPISGNWSAWVGGGANMQHFNNITIVNPVAEFGVRHWAKNDDGTTSHIININYKCLFDDANNSIGNPQVWRGYEINPSLIKKFSGAFGFQIGLKVQRQANSALFTARTQATFYGGLVIGAQ